MSGFRLSPQQRRIFRLDLGRRPGGRTQAIFRLSGEIDAADLERAARDLIARHEILRTAFPKVAGLELPVQEPGEPWDLELECHDVIDLDDQRQHERVESIRQEALERAFDLARPELVDLDLIRLASDASILSWTQPALIGDGEGVVALARELLASLTGSGEIEAEPMQYADVADWLNEILEGEDAAEGLAYWRRIHAEIPVVDLSLAAGTGPAESFRPGLTEVPVEEEDLTRLGEWAARRGSSIDSVLQVLWAALLARYADSDRVPLATHFDGRSYEGLESAAGPFSRYLPLVVDLTRTPGLAEAVSRLDGDLSAAADWQEYHSWEKLGRGGSPAVFGYESRRLPDGRMGSLEWSAERVDTWIEPHLLKLDVRGSGDAAAGESAPTLELASDASRIGASDRRDIAAAFAALINAAAADPESPPADLPLVAPAAEDELVERLAVGKTDDPPAATSILELIEEQVAEGPERIAVIDPRERTTYHSLWERSGALADRLASQGIGAGSIVAVCCRRSTDMVIAILGALRAGAAYLPLDPGYPPERLEFMARDAAAEIILSHQATSELAARIGAPELRLDETPDTAEVATRPHGELAYVIYTSGSTGEPKGVAVGHRNLLYSTAARLRHYETRPERFLLLSSYAFDSSIVGLFWTLASGSTLVLPADGTEQDTTALAEIIAAERITHTLCLPTLYHLLLEQADSDSLASLQSVIVAGEACPATLVARHFQLRPEAALINEYGPTEATVWATSCELTRDDETAVPIGRPIPFARVYVLDRLGRPVPPGVAGEISIGGEGVTRGYVGRPRLTSERFGPDRFAPRQGARLYRTGDRGRWRSDGRLEFLGRLDHQVKIRGVRVEPEEVETHLTRHPAVQQAVVVPRADDTGQPRLVAYLVADEAPTVSDLRLSLEQHLPEPMIPGQFVFLDELPLAPNGKVDRAALPEPGEARPDLAAAYVEPEGALERYLAEQWRTVLQTERIGVLDNFFELGGNSIQAAIFMNRLRGEIDDFVHVGRLFEHPTVRALAEFLEEEHSGAVARFGNGREAPRELDESTLESIDRLSDDEVDSMLDELLSEEEGAGS